MTICCFNASSWLLRMTEVRRSVLCEFRSGIVNNVCEAIDLAETGSFPRLLADARFLLAEMYQHWAIWTRQSRLPSKRLRQRGTAGTYILSRIGCTLWRQSKRPKGSVKKRTAYSPRLPTMWIQCQFAEPPRQERSGAFDGRDLFGPCRAHLRRAAAGHTRQTVRFPGRQLR